jgi:hypothetical protein
MSRGARQIAWAWLVGLLVIAGTYVAARVCGPDPESIRFNLPRLTEAPAGSSVMIGSSLTACALPIENSPGMEAAPPIYRISQGNGVQEDYEPVLNPVLASKANIVLLEAEMLLRDREPRTLAYRTAFAYRDPVSLWLRQMAGRRIVNANYANAECSTGVATPETMEHLGSAPHLARTQPWSPAMIGFIRRAKADGKRVVLVSIGRSTVLSEQLDPTYLRSFESNLDKASRELGVEVWRFPTANLPLDHYSDGGHLNGAGRSVFVPWLQQQLKDARGRP